VQAFARAHIDLRVHLVFTGESNLPLADWIEKQGVTLRVNFVGSVPEEKLPSLYRGATALIFPSLYEGFGLPLLEAMACGTPVVTAKVTALPEVAGDAALLADPTSVDEIAAAIENVTGDDSLRLQLKEKGLARARSFTWAGTCARVHRLLSGE
jgi:glycosyltransferase involved in cell wall biosynthesis